MAHSAGVRETAHYERQIDAMLDKISEQAKKIAALEVTAEVCLLREEAIARVVVLHVPNEHGLCVECYKDHPCDTFKALLPQ